LISIFGLNDPNIRPTISLFIRPDRQHNDQFPDRIWESHPYGAEAKLDLPEGKQYALFRSTGLTTVVDVIDFGVSFFESLCGNDISVFNERIIADALSERSACIRPSQSSELCLSGNAVRDRGGDAIGEDLFAGYVSRMPQQRIAV